jgi:prepilin-type N-terminal cleavage/methylation domain-containing protein
LTSDVAAPTGREGFSLVEVLVAMVILAIGLLALEALGIGAARAVARADVQSEYTALATERMEQTLLRIRQNLALNTGVTTVGTATVTTDVVPVVVGTQRAYTVTVTVAPPNNPHLSLQPVTLVVREIRPNVAP